MNIRRWGYGAAAAVLLISCGGTPVEESASEPRVPVTVQVETLVESSHPQTVPLTGVVRPRRQVTIAAQVMGYVKGVSVEEGQRVSVGEPLIALANDGLEASTAAARAGEDQAEAAILVAQHATIAAEANLALAQASYDRYEGLLAKESVSQQEFDVATAGLRTAEAAVEQARAQTSRAEASRSEAVAQITSADTMLGYASITSPIIGVVTTRMVEPGDLANPGQTLLEIEETGEYRLESPVPESLIASVRVGQEVAVAIDALGEGGPTVGRIAQIDRSADAASRTFLVKVAVRSSPGLRSGLYGQVFLPADQRTILTVPADAVVERGQLHTVFTVTGGMAERRLVTLGQLSEGSYEVLSGLDAGERVILDPFTVSDGSAVEERR